MDNLIDAVVAFQILMKQEGIPVMAIGGIAVAIWGEPRLTRDIDSEGSVAQEKSRPVAGASTKKVITCPHPRTGKAFPECVFLSAG